MALSVYQNFYWNEDDLEREPERELVKELVAEPLVGHRLWGIQRPDSLVLTEKRLAELAERFDRRENPFRGLLGPRLAGIGSGFVWDEPTLHAECGSTASSVGFSATTTPSMVPPTEGVPHRNCGCGVWAMKNEDALQKAAAQYVSGSPYSYAYGTVQLWGRIYEHQIGYRAQHGRPIEITLVNGDEKTARELSEFYGCPVKLGEPLPYPKYKPEEIDNGPGAPINLHSSLTYNSAFLAGYNSVALYDEPEADFEPLGRFAGLLVSMAGGALAFGGIFGLIQLIGLVV